MQVKQAFSRPPKFVLALSALLLAHATAAAGRDAVTKVTLRAPGTQPLRDVPGTFGQVFRQGDIEALSFRGLASVARRGSRAVAVPSDSRLPFRGERRKAEPSGADAHGD